MTSSADANPRSAGLTARAIFFALGAAVAGISAVSLFFPGSVLEPMWRVNVRGHDALRILGAASAVLMVVVSLACGAASAGVWRRAEWGRRLAIGLLAVNLAGDATGALVRRDPRTLIGLPNAGALIVYLSSAGVRRRFEKRGT